MFGVKHLATILISPQKVCIQAPKIMVALLSQKVGCYLLPQHEMEICAHSISAQANYYGNTNYLLRHLQRRQHTEINGKQYLVIACGGGKLKTTSSDTYIAFALPE